MFLFRQKLMPLRSEAISFIFIGALNTVVGYLLYAFFLLSGLHYMLALLLANGLGVLFSFHTMGKFVFLNLQKNLLTKFILVYIILYFLNILFLKSIYIFLQNYYWSGLCAIPPTAVIAFYINKYVVFNKHDMHNTTR